MSDIVLRKADASSMEALREMSLLLQRHVEVANPKIWRLTSEGELGIRTTVENMLRDEDGLAVIAESEGVPVGFIHGSFRRRRDYEPETVGYINYIFVREGFRRRGIGRLLVREVSTFFASKGVEDVTLNYVDGNRDGEMFWRSLGFEHRLHIANTSLEALREKLT
jgi:GNAT superfamily N-acetyltransferase